MGLFELGDNGQETCRETMMMIKRRARGQKGRLVEQGGLERKA